MYSALLCSLQAACITCSAAACWCPSAAAINPVARFSESFFWFASHLHFSLFR
ncbi:hypothetical protein PF005_g27744 [Phytophthora fragariae]|uniref:Secreted protein n=2 Tax=Phytophthora TaxID=4783 RepID=A0A6A3DQL3_9STRA|nr:hypothetical protein PF003_g799 [Phytophthora fragariae]KAE8962626.1 hypothetical protein PR002_g29544 [Phytophthora rubi]KAE8921391.1 hypothetical protein PF009_g28334 [Phytophthora fragariae]KAE8963754.1 hypothetical protein PR001_g29274 [Phytophthora rubi]KAE8969555.1 hypothetical protein PF011_g26758 [Phytophthora fragariae]